MYLLEDSGAYDDESCLAVLGVSGVLVLEKLDTSFPPGRGV